MYVCVHTYLIHTRIQIQDSITNLQVHCAEVQARREEIAFGDDASMRGERQTRG